MSRLARSAADDRLTRALLPRATRRWRHREHVIRRGAAAGLRINLHGSRPSYVLGIGEPDTQRLPETWLRPGAVFYDLGASVGFFSLIAAQLVGRRGRGRGCDVTIHLLRPGRRAC